MRLRLITGIIITAIIVVACQGPPPTQIVVVVTATPQGGAIAVEATSTAEVTSEASEPPATPTATLTPTPDPFPTPVTAQINVAEQRFQNGRMFWLQPVDQIWVMTFDDDDEPIWSVYDNTFFEGDLEIDPEIEAPIDLYQPERGFGKLWRENPEVRQALGWAIEPEFGHSTRYEYHAGGTVNDELEYEAAPGYHLVGSLYGDVVRFNEGEWTWELVRE